MSNKKQKTISTHNKIEMEESTALATHRHKQALMTAVPVLAP